MIGKPTPTIRYHSMKLTAREIAEYLGGTVEGDPNCEVHDFAKIEAGQPGMVSFLSNPKYEHYIYSTKSSIVLVNKGFQATAPIAATLVRVEDSYGALAQLLTLVASQMPRKKGIHPRAVVEPSASIGKDVYIGALAYVGENAVIGDYAQIYPQVYVGDNAHIGSETTLYAGVRIYNECEVGDRCILHAGAVIGADGFGFAPQGDGSYTKIPQLGNVVIGNDVEIGANTCIDRAAMGATTVAEGVKLDNLVQIAHNVSIGSHTVMASQCGVAGSTKVGKHCVFGGQVGLVGHIAIADGVQIGAQAGVLNSVKTNKENLIGSPTMPVRDFFRSMAIFRQLPHLANDIYSLKKNQEDDTQDQTHQD